MAPLTPFEERKIGEAHCKLEQGFRDEAALTLTRMMANWCQIEQGKLEREGGWFDRSQMTFQSLLEGDISVRDRIVCLNNLAWLVRQPSSLWFGVQPAADSLDETHRLLDQAERAAVGGEQDYRIELAETRHQRAVERMLRAESPYLMRPSEHEFVCEAHSQIRRALSVRSVMSDKPLDLARSLVVEAWILRRLGRWGDALRAYHSALDIRVAAFNGDRHPDVAVVLCFIAGLQEEFGASDCAKRIYQRARVAFECAATSLDDRDRLVRLHPPLLRFWQPYQCSA